VKHILLHIGGSWQIRVQFLHPCADSGLRSKMDACPSLASPWPMISIADANRISLMHTIPLPAVAVPLGQSLVCRPLLGRCIKSAQAVAALDLQQGLVNNVTHGCIKSFLLAWHAGVHCIAETQCQ